MTRCRRNRNDRKHILKRWHLLPLSVVLLVIFGNATVRAADTHHEINPRNGIETWAVHDRGVFLSVTQITPDQAQAFLLGRDFGHKPAEEYASACVFQAIFRNESVPAAVSSNLANWRIVTPHGVRSLKLRADWERQWRAHGVPEPARIAFRWSQFPTSQRFETGDWNQGMISVDLPRGSRFNLRFKWTIKGVSHEGILSGVRCAADDSR